MSPPAQTVRWLMPPTVDASNLSATVPGPVARVLTKRGIDTLPKLQAFLEPPHRLPYDPLRLSGMDAALGRLYQAAEKHEHVAVFGDFDVDGITGTAIVSEGLTELGVQVTPYLPHRVDEGHGLSIDAVNQLGQDGVTLIITVDCGITAFEEIAHAKASGIDVIITDHHIPESSLPDAVAAINPKLPGGTYPFFELCGAGLGFKLIQGLYEFYGQPWDPGLLELAAMGTIADLVPMLDENRYLVSEGIQQLAQTKRPGLIALYNSARVKPEEITGEIISFQIAPRLNSAGRMGHPMDSFRLLTTTSPEEASEITQRLESLNIERRDLTQTAYAMASDQVDALDTLPSLLVIADETIPRGVAGLVAGRLADRYRRPAVVLAVEEDFAVASARSIPEFNIVEAIGSCEDLLVRFGGHTQAAGLTVPRAAIPELTSRLVAYADKVLDSGDLTPSLEIDVVVGLEELTQDVIDWIATLEPFGPGHRRPLFASSGVQIVDYRYMGHEQQHVRFRVAQNGVELTALCFNQGWQWQSEQSGEGATLVDLAYSVSIDAWQGNNTLALRVSSFRLSQD